MSEKNFFIKTWCVVVAVIQATGKLDFDDGLRMIVKLVLRSEGLVYPVGFILDCSKKFQQ